MKILFFTKYNSKGASSRYRTFQYLPYLTENKIFFSVSYLFGSKYLTSLYSKSRLTYLYAFLCYIKRLVHFFRIFNYDIIVIEYELFPFLPAIFEYILKWTGKKYIVDYDDAIFHNYDLSKNKLIRYVLKNKIKNVINNATCVITGSEYLYNYAKKHNHNVYKIPTVVDINMYQSVKSINDQSSFVIGWIGSPSTSYYLIPLASVFRRLQFPDIKYNFIGTDATIRKFFEGIKVDWIEWNAETEIKNIKSFSVGLMPLDNTPWSKGKCGFKLIQYLACGIPVIASDVGENNIIVEHGQNGYLVQNEDDWYHYILKMYNERLKLYEKGLCGQKLIEEKYSLQITSKKLIEIFKSNY